jgi:hypothetical protein
MHKLVGKIHLLWSNEKQILMKICSLLGLLCLALVSPQLANAQRVSEWYNDEPDYVGGGDAGVYLPLLIGFALGTIIQRLLEKRLNGNVGGSWTSTFFYGMWFVTPMTCALVAMLWYA